MRGRLAVTGIAGLCLTAVAAGDDIATNGGFEMGDAGDSAAWTEFGAGAAGTLSERTMDMPISDLWSHVIHAAGDATGGGSAGINQNSIVDGGLASLQEMTSLSLSFQAETDFGPGGVGFYAIRVLNGDGAIVADSGLQPIVDGMNNSADIMVPAFGGAPNDTYAAFVEFVANAGAFDGSFAEVKLDDVVVNGTLIPAPGAAALIGLGTLAMMRRRR